MIFFIIANICENKLPIPARSARSNFKNLIFIDFILFCFSEIFDRLILVIICQIEGAIVNPERFLDREFTLKLHTFEWVGMYWCHEPSGFIGAYRDESDIESLRIFLIYRIDKWTISRISGKIERFSCYFHTKSSPECFIPISESTSREMLRRKIDDFCSHLSFLVFYFLPPIHFYDVFYLSILKIPDISKTSIYKGIIFCFELPQSRDIHMIIVIV